jgi:hypothetical protein
MRLKHPAGITALELVLGVWVDAAMRGDAAARNALLDRIEGRAPHVEPERPSMLDDIPDDD